MTDKKSALRKQAEQPADRVPEDLQSLSPEEIRRTLHELRMHQIELEMQNEELRRTQLELDAARARYFDLYDLAPVGYCTLGEQGLILEANLTAAGMLGVPRGALVKQFISRFILKPDQDIYFRHRHQLNQSGDPQAFELRMVKKDGTAFWAHLTATAAQGDDGAQVGRIVLTDITAQKQAEMNLQYLSMHDALTGLYNRSYFEESMERLERGRQFPVSILMADVDGLKSTNDRFGHAAGDRLLKRIAHLLAESFRAEDVIARIGGDEFAILMPNTNAADAESVLLRFRQNLVEHNAIYTEPPLQLSCGISTTEIKAPLIETLKQADTQMYLEKRGRNGTAQQ
jgi:diguanylate cyclase (GGDEF)-like protein/PAS domain S-box-containing protein